MDLLRNRTSGLVDVKIIPTIKNINTLDIKNQRPQDYLEEREAYEQLCRQNSSRVKENFLIKQIFIF